MTPVFDIANTDVVKPQVENRENRGRRYAERLERGDILFFPETPFDLPADHLSFLLDQRQSAAKYHKNISYRPGADRLTGLDKRSRQNHDRLRAIMRDYSARVTRFLEDLLPQYTRHLRIDYASFRAEEEQGRQLRQTARNDLLHLDSFPTRPTNGDRILRVFTNVNPIRPRVWLTTDTFENLIYRFTGNREGTAAARPLLAPSKDGFGPWLSGVLKAAGLPVANPSPYDRFMHQLHNHMKLDEAFQRDCPKQRREFPPHSTWIVFTDMVAHAVLSGQFALEQTYIISRKSLVLPVKAPINILEGIYRRVLTS